MSGCVGRTAARSPPVSRYGEVSRFATIRGVSVIDRAMPFVLGFAVIVAVGVAIAVVVSRVIAG